MPEKQKKKTKLQQDRDRNNENAKKFARKFDKAVSDFTRNQGSSFPLRPYDRYKQGLEAMRREDTIKRTRKRNARNNNQPRRGSPQ